METSNKKSKIESFIIGIGSDILRLKHKKGTKYNIKREKYGRLRELQDYKSIVITQKKTDRGAALVPMNRRDYIGEEYRQLCECNFWNKLDPKPNRKSR